VKHIGRRSGKFPGMLKERTFRIVWVSQNHGAGNSATEKPDAVVHYHGAPVKMFGPQ
jgi:alpha-D-xyloside xylohydrolase